jgi:hypothetical protein
VWPSTPTDHSPGKVTHACSERSVGIALVSAILAGLFQGTDGDPHFVGFRCSA